MATEQFKANAAAKSDRRLAMDRPSGAPRTTPHRSFLDDDVADGHEHGERMDGVLREDELVGTSSSHAPPPDTRAEEPFGEVAPSADTQGRID